MKMKLIAMSLLIACGDKTETTTTVDGTNTETQIVEEIKTTETQEVKNTETLTNETETTTETTVIKETKLEGENTND